MASRKAQILALSIGQIAGQIISLATAMIMTRMLPKSEFAAYRQTLLAYSAAAPFFGLGISQAIFYFLPKEDKRIRGRVLDAAFLLLVSGMVCAAFIVLGGNQVLAHRFHNPRVAGMLLMIAPCALVALPAGIVSSVLVVRGESLRSSIISVSSQLGIGICTITGLICFASAEAAMSGYVLGTLITGCIAFWIMFRMMPADECTLSFPEMRHTLAFSVPLGASFMIGHLAMQMGGLLISVTASPQAFAVFAIGSQELPLQIITSSITSVILADMTLRFGRGEGRLASQLWTRAASKSLLFLLPSFAFLMTFADDYVILLFSRDYAASIPVFRVFLLLLPLRAFFFGSILIAAGESRFILVRTAVWAALVIVCSIVVFNWTGIMGVAWVIVLSQYLFAAPMNFQKISRITGVKWIDLVPCRDFAITSLAAAAPLLVAIPARGLHPSFAGATLAALTYGVGLTATFTLCGLVSPLAVGRFVRQSVGGSVR